MGRLSESGQLWLYRCKPQDDELLSSWLVRLAWGLAVKLQVLCVHVLGQRRNVLASDIDLNPGWDLLKRLADGTGIPLSRAAETGLAAYAGRLWADRPIKGPLAWVIPIYRDSRRRLRHGVQYCSECLREDETPYFRRAWRLSFCVACEEHSLFLRDACGVCGAPIEFHVGDFGARLLSYQCRITRCPACGHDLRECDEAHIPRPSPRLLSLQRKLSNALIAGFSTELPGAEIFSFIHFEGLRYLAGLLVLSGKGGRLREALLEQRQLPANALGGSNRSFEELRQAERALAMELCAELLEEWPYRFIQECRKCRVASSYVIRYGREMPYWLYREVRWDLNDRDYTVAKDERESVIRYLQKQGLPVNDLAIDILLGKRYPRDIVGRVEVSRWNPRGSLR